MMVITVLKKSENTAPGSVMSSAYNCKMKLHFLLIYQFMIQISPGLLEISHFGCPLAICKVSPLLPHVHFMPAFRFIPSGPFLLTLQAPTLALGSKNSSGFCCASGARTSRCTLRWRVPQLLPYCGPAGNWLLVRAAADSVSATE